VDEAFALLITAGDVLDPSQSVREFRRIGIRYVGLLPFNQTFLGTGHEGCLRLLASWLRPD
jgi:hypothetical protein